MYFTVMLSKLPVYLVNNNNSSSAINFINHINGAI